VVATTTGPTLMEGVERINAVMVHPTQWVGFALYNSYTINVDKENRNCYNCGVFRHLARNCRNGEMGGRIEKDRRLEYGRNKQRTENNEPSNLNGDKNLIVLD